MVTPVRGPDGAYRARKRLPADVREEYGRLYGPRHEAKFFRPASTKPHEAKREFCEWLAEVESRIDAIRKQRKGEGIALTHQQARALAGDWYKWFVARHPLSDRAHWEHLRENIHEALRAAVGEARWEAAENPDDLCREDEELKTAIHAVFADAGETAQFFQLKCIVPDNEARRQFLDILYDDLAHALKYLIRTADGDYSPDQYRERFPRFEGTDNGETPLQLFERWVVERKPALSSVETWGYVFRAMSKHFEGRSAASIIVDEARQWLKSRITEERSAGTVRGTDLRASNTVFDWAAEHKYVTANPFKGVKITVPKQRRTRDTKAFRPDEYRMILKAAHDVADTHTTFGAAKRWVPWLCAYTGARSGEITQLRKRDVVQREGIWAIEITPDAGTVKNRQARTVPVHEYLITQGFVKFAQGHRDGPLFYTPAPKGQNDDPLTAKKPRSVQIRQRLAAWVRELGVTDPELRPNHAWRHTFKQIADRYGISVRVSDAITGHAPASVGQAYGAPTLEDMADAMKKFPRYKLEAKAQNAEMVQEEARNED